jgi:hypothetical protein
MAIPESTCSFCHQPTVVGIIVVAIYKHFVPYTFDKQAGKNYAAAERHIPILKPLLMAFYSHDNKTSNFYDELCERLSPLCRKGRKKGA